LSPASETVVIGGDLTVCRLGFGTMALTGRGTWGEPSDPAAARALLRRAAELGVQLFDTADSYGPETVERLVRDALHPYEGLVIATKGGFRRHGPHEWSADCRPASLRAACEAGLQRLGLERIDLYQLHLVDPAVPLEESLGALAELREEGKVRHVGICNVSPAELDRARAVTEIASVQNRLSLAERGSDDVLARCDTAGIPFLAWAPLAKGFLARTAWVPADVARARDATPGQVALAWLLHRSPRLAVIPGTASQAHLEENVAAGAIRLSPEEVARLDGERLLGYRARRAVRRARSTAGRARRKMAGRRP